MRILSLLYVYFALLGSQGIVPVPAPVDLTVLSNNFIHILQWSPGKGTQPGTVYNVKIRDNQSLGINSTSADVSEYMKDKYLGYKIQLWASFGNRSSSTVNIHFTPFTTTTIGPPQLFLSGCGGCLNISIDLPNRQGANDFYNAVSFNMHWRKAKDEKDGCDSPLTKYQTKRSVPYSYVLKHLEPGERYCVHVQPVSSFISSSKSSCSCEFTSQIEPRGVAFLAWWVAGSLLVGLCFLSFSFGLVYTGFLCKPNVRLPKALIILVPGYFISPEKTHISAVEIEYGVQIHQEKKEKENGCHKQTSDVDEDDNDEDDDEESHHGYMDRAVCSESESSGSSRSAPVCEAAENPGLCSIEDEPADAKKNSLSFAQLRYDRDKGYDRAASLDSVTVKSNPPNAKGGKILGGPMKEEGKEKEGEEEEEDSGNVNLWSVVLKSMQPEEEEADELSEAEEPLLPVLLKELQEDSLTAAKPQTGSSSELHTALLFPTQTELQTSQGDEKDTSLCDHVRTGYMASHTGTIDKENYSSDDEEEDYTSGYMTR